VASLAGLSIVVADEATPLVDLRQEAMPAIDEGIYRIMAARSLIVTADAKIGLMTDRAVHLIHRSHAPVQIATPSYRVRLRLHNAVALVAIAA
jgi:hypothetical protein